LHKENFLGMCKMYKTKKEAQEAVKKAVGMRREWEDAIRNKATREQMEMKGMKTVVINEH